MLRRVPKDDYVRVIYLQPKPIIPVYDLYPILTLLYSLCCNFLFDIAYLLIKNKKESVLFRTMLLVLFLGNSYLSFFLFLFNILKHIFWKAKHNSIVDFMYDYFYTAQDDRKIMLNNNNWEANPDPLKLTQVLLKHEVYLEVSKFKSLSSVLQEFRSKVEDFKKSCSFVQTCMVKSKTLSDLPQHKCIIDSFDSTHNTICTQTSFFKAFRSDFLKKKVGAIAYAGDTKETTQLIEKKEDLIEIPGRFKQSTFNLSVGIWQTKDLKLTRMLASRGVYELPPYLRQRSNEVDTLEALYVEFKFKVAELNLPEPAIKELFFLTLPNASYLSEKTIDEFFNKPRDL